MARRQQGVKRVRREPIERQKAKTKRKEKEGEKASTKTD